MNLLNKDAILAAQDLKTERVTVKEWGGEVIVSEMGGLTAVEFWEFLDSGEGEDESAATQKNIARMFKPAAIAFCVVDEDGNRLFANDDIPHLARKNIGVIKRVFAVVDKLNLLTRAAQENAAKNSVGGEDGAADSSTSPESSDSPASGTSPES